MSAIEQIKERLALQHRTDCSCSYCRIRDNKVLTFAAVNQQAENIATIRTELSPLDAENKVRESAGLDPLSLGQYCLQQKHYKE